MFSELTLTELRFFFKYLSLGRTPYEWNDRTNEVTVTNKGYKLLRWKLASEFQIFYAIFIFIRCFQSVVFKKIPIDEIMYETKRSTVFRISALFH